MYRIVKRLDGTYVALCMIQDGEEVYPVSNRAEGVQKLIRAAKTMNGSTITEHDIQFGEEKQVVKTEVFWEEKPKCHHCGH